MKNKTTFLFTINWRLLVYVTLAIALILILCLILIFPKATVYTLPAVLPSGKTYTMHIRKSRAVGGPNEFVLEGLTKTNVHMTEFGNRSKIAEASWSLGWNYCALMASRFTATDSETLTHNLIGAKAMCLEEFRFIIGESAIKLGYIRPIVTNYVTITNWVQEIYPEPSISDL